MIITWSVIFSKVVFLQILKWHMQPSPGHKIILNIMFYSFLLSFADFGALWP